MNSAYMLEFRFKTDDGIFRIPYNPSYVSQIFGKHNRFRTVPFKWKRTESSEIDDVIAEFSFCTYVSRTTYGIMQDEEPEKRVDIKSNWSVKYARTGAAFTYYGRLSVADKRKFADYLLQFKKNGPGKPFIE